MFRRFGFIIKPAWLCLAAVLILMPAPPAHAQPPAGEGEGMEFSLSFMPEYQGETDLDRGGDFSVWRLSLKAAFERKISERFEAGADVGYALDAYSFSGVTALGGGEPWEDIHRLTVGNTYRYRFSDAWSLFAKPSVELALESGGEWDDALLFGAMAAVSRKFGPDLTVGAGLGVETGIEDTDVFPVFLIRWQIREGVRLGNPLRPGPGGAGGLELTFSPAGSWEFMGIRGGRLLPLPEVPPGRQRVCPRRCGRGRGPALLGACLTEARRRVHPGLLRRRRLFRGTHR
jgi:hypothetical protein